MATDAQECHRRPERVRPYPHTPVMGARLRSASTRGRSGVEWLYAILDTYRIPEGLLFSLAHPRCGSVVQPTYAAYLKHTEPTWKALRFPPRKGRRYSGVTSIAPTSTASSPQREFCPVPLPGMEVIGTCV